MSKNSTVRLADWSPFPFAVESIFLNFQIYDDCTVVDASSRWTRTGNAADLELFGKELELQEVRVNGEVRDDCQPKNGILRISAVPDTFEMQIRTLIRPAENKALEGLYRSGGNYCTQCEAEGFRRITFFADRPDVLTRYTTRIEAAADVCPVMLANGNPVDRGDAGEGRHFVVWEDPFPKPCYLFALVAGRLVVTESSFTTRSGRRVALKIYVEERNRDRCDFAMTALKHAMRWDEEVFGLEYDLDIFMIVAVDDFNMGAMENKGLNIFNSKYVLTSPDSATDRDYLGVEGVIGHEYFHNWTGNRVTCRDWFQLSLKEGLTVFRDQEFSADMNSRAVQRIDDVRLLREVQFKEDASPMAHPVRPDNYEEINNFYTATIYNKGAEVIRMIHTLIGAEAFRRGMDLYFERHDGQAVTCEDFVAAMADASGFDLDQFFLWYQQAGTPLLSVAVDWDKEAGEFHLEVSQQCAPTPGQKTKKPLLIPITVGLVGSSGDLELAGGAREEVLLLDRPSARFTLKCQSDERPVLSFLRNFSAPVRVKPFLKRTELARLAAVDGNLFNRWSSARQLATEVIVEVAEQMRRGERVAVDPLYLHAVRRSLVGRPEDAALLALSLQLPSEGTLALELEAVDPEILFQARRLVKRRVAEENRNMFEHLCRQCSPADYRVTPQQVGRRSLANVALDFLTALKPLPPEVAELCSRRFYEAGNMTEQAAALASLAEIGGEMRDAAFAEFYDRWRNDPVVIDKWFAFQALSSQPDTLSRVETLLADPLFELTNPNKVRALIGSFCSGNHCRFHAADGAGYRFLADRVLELDPVNPQIAARLCTPLISWRRYEHGRSALMKKELNRIAATRKLSKDVAEIVRKSLV